MRPEARASTTPPSGWPRSSSRRLPAPDSSGISHRRSRHQTVRPMKLPDKLGPIHFIGIGGIRMSGIGEELHHLRYTLKGSDAPDNANVRRLAKKGMRTFVGHDAENVAEAALV